MSKLTGILFSVFRMLHKSPGCYPHDDHYFHLSASQRIIYILESWYFLVRINVQMGSECLQSWIPFSFCRDAAEARSTQVINLGTRVRAASLCIRVLNKAGALPGNSVKTGTETFNWVAGRYYTYLRLTWKALRKLKGEYQKLLHSKWNEMIYQKRLSIEDNPESKVFVEIRVDTLPSRWR